MQAFSVQWQEKSVLFLPARFILRLVLLLYLAPQPLEHASVGSRSDTCLLRGFPQPRVLVCSLGHQGSTKWHDCWIQQPDLFQYHHVMLEEGGGEVLLSSIQASLRSIQKGIENRLTLCNKDTSFWRLWTSFSNSQLRTSPASVHGKPVLDFILFLCTFLKHLLRLIEMYIPRS